MPLVLPRTRTIPNAAGTPAGALAEISKDKFAGLGLTHWYDAKDIKLGTEQTLPNRINPAGAALQMGSTTGVDLNDPTDLPWPGQNYLWCPGTAGNFAALAGGVLPAHTVLSMRFRNNLAAAYTGPQMQTSSNTSRFYVNPTTSNVNVTTTIDGGTTAQLTSIPLTNAHLYPWVEVELDMAGNRTRARVSSSTTYDPDDVVWDAWLAWVTIASPVKTLAPGAGNSSFTFAQAGALYRCEAFVDGVVFPSLTFDPVADPTFAGLTVTRSATGLKTALVDRPKFQLDVVNDTSIVPINPSLQEDFTYLALVNTTGTTNTFGRLADNRPASGPGVTIYLDYSSGVRCYVVARDSTGYERSNGGAGAAPALGGMVLAGMRYTHAARTLESIVYAQSTGLIVVSAAVLTLADCTAAAPFQLSDLTNGTNLNGEFIVPAIAGPIAATNDQIVAIAAELIRGSYA